MTDAYVNWVANLSDEDLTVGFTSLNLEINECKKQNTKSRLKYLQACYDVNMEEYMKRGLYES